MQNRPIELPERPERTHRFPQNPDEDGPRLLSRAVPGAGA